MPVFYVSAGLLLLFVIVTLIFPFETNAILTGIRDRALGSMDWLLALAPIIAFISCLLIIVSPLGSIRLGLPDEKPEFSFLSWISMLFAAGVGVGYVLYGAAEPLTFYAGWSGTPFNIPAETAQAERLAMSATLFHWTLMPWSVYAIMGLCLAFFSYNKGFPLAIRSAFYPIFGRHIWGWIGHTIDSCAVISTTFGLATSIGLGAIQVTSGISYLAGTQSTLSTQILLISGITAIAVGSIWRGMDKGIKFLSNLNVTIAFGLLSYVILFGTGFEIILISLKNIKNLFLDSLPLMNWFNRTDLPFFHSWTIFYWSWWISWSPFVGIFIAYISRGRTVREYLLTVLIAPFFIGVLWFSSFGQTAITQYKEKILVNEGEFSDFTLILFNMLANLPFPTFTSVITLLLLIIFITTSADSGALVIENMAAGHKTKSPLGWRMFWTLMFGITSSALLFGGGKQALKALQSGAIIAALPFTLILIVSCLSLILGLRDEYYLTLANKKHENKT